MTILSTGLVLIVAYSNSACNGLHNILPSKNHINVNNGLLPTAAFHRSAAAVVTTLRAVPSESGGVVPTKDKPEATLTLKGEFTIASANLPTTSIQDAVEFFRSTEARDLFMSSGGEKPCTELATISPPQLDDWKTRCSALGARPPTANDSILSVVTQGIQFPGLQVKSNALIGAKYVDNTMEEDQQEEDGSKSNAVPRYEFVLLDTEQIASGIAPAVWIFNKLTGGSSDSTTFESLSTVTLEDDAATDTIVFRSNARLSLGISFPKLLLKILPGDKETIEERGGKSITKALVTDVSKSMESFEVAYRKKFGV